MTDKPTDALLALAERLERMIAEPAWLIFYMNKEEAAQCAQTLRTLASQGAE
jgi:hypothetical protein